MITGIDHIAIAVENIDSAIELFEKKLGLRLHHRETVESQGVETATFEIGGTAIELVEGKTETSAIRKFIETKGPGIHHIAFTVDDVEDAISDLRKKEMRLIDESPKPGKENSRIAFIHPKSTQKILFEMVERAKD